MLPRDQYSVYVRLFEPREIGWRTLADGRRVLDITADISAYIKPTDEGLPETIAGLRLLAASAIAMADDLEAATAPERAERPEVDEARAAYEARA